MVIVYEHSLINKFILAFNEKLPKQRLIKFTYLTDLKKFATTNELATSDDGDDGDEIIVLFSGVPDTNFYTELVSYISRPITLIRKPLTSLPTCSSEEALDDNSYAVINNQLHVLGQRDPSPPVREENWYRYWAIARAASIECGVDEQIVDAIYRLSIEYPALTDRYILQYFNTIVDLGPEHFRQIVLDESFVGIREHGKRLLKQLQPHIDHAVQHGMKLDKVFYCCTNTLETAYQILERQVIDTVVLLSISLRHKCLFCFSVSRTHNDPPLQDEIIADWSIRITNFINLYQLPMGFIAKL
jgi:hypothetical protein